VPDGRAKLKGHRSKINRDILRLPKQVFPEIPIEPFALLPLLSGEDMRRSKDDGPAAKSQDHLWERCYLVFFASAEPIEAGTSDEPLIVYPALSAPGLPEM